MEIYQLQYFLEVAQTRNFTRAAERLHIAQPALSEQIRRLEEELGTKLIDRGRRESVLTAAGKVLAERASGLLDQLESTKRAVQDIVGLRAGRLVLGAIPSVSACVLPPVVAEFRHRYGQVELLLVEGTSESVAEWVEAGRVDVGIVQLPVSGERLVSVELLRERFVLLVDQSHRLVCRKKIAVEDLAGEQFVFYKGRARDSALEACRLAGFVPKIACESGELETVRSLVAAGLGVAILPELAGKQDRSNCVSIPIVDPNLMRTLSVIRSDRRAESPASIAFTELLGMSTSTTRRSAKRGPTR
ncbi:MAG: LysR family transcriptional regulator [Verrucomicrobiota bacterium]